MEHDKHKINATDRQYQTISVVLKKHQKLKDHCFNKQKRELSQSSQKILKNARRFSTGEIILIKIALDIWNGSGNAKVTEIIESLDAQNFSNVLEGLGLLAKFKLNSENWFNNLVNQTDASSPGKDLVEG